MKNKTAIKIVLSLVVLALVVSISILVYQNRSRQSQSTPNSAISNRVASNTASMATTTTGQAPLTSNRDTTTPGNGSVTASATTTTATSTLLYPPLPDALKRVTKKPFGIFVSPGHSPVSPERFTGYHTGVDFEIFPGEENVDVPVSAVCPGTLIYKNYVSGYGGVAITSCRLAGRDVTVLYGHLRLSSITNRVGDKIKAGEKIAVLGTGYSTETDGERKHLHLGIHIGTAIDLKGYVQTRAELSGWLDATKYLK